MRRLSETNQWPEVEIKQEIDNSDMEEEEVELGTPSSTTSNPFNQDFEEADDMLDLVAPPPPNISNTQPSDLDKSTPAAPRNINWDSEDLFAAKYKTERCFFNPDANDVLPRGDAKPPSLPDVDNLKSDADFPSTYTVRGNFPNSIPYSSAKVLALIKAQNDVDTSLWKLELRKSEHLDHFITFEVDRGSWSKLLQLNGLISYRFGQVKLQLSEIKNCTKHASQTKELPQLRSQRVVRAILPHSHEYTNDKVLAIIKAQNGLDVSQWKSVERKPTDLYFTFEIDDKSWLKLMQLKGVISYRFERIKLEMIESKSCPELEKDNSIAKQPPEKPLPTPPSARIVRGNFPLSHSYTDEKVLALIKAQNDLDVSQWKPLPRKTNSSQFTFEVDDNSWQKLVNLEGVICYRFGQLKLEMICKSSDDQVEDNCKTNKVMAAANPQRIEAPTRRLVRGDFPQSQEYPNEKVLALIKTQNNLDVSQWKPLPRKSNSSHFTFEIDDSSWQKLVNLEGVIFYRFGQLKLEMICKSSDEQVEDNCKTNKVMAEANPPRIEAPTRRLVRGDFPQSQEYPNEKVLALIKAQNNLDVSQWKPLPRKSNSSQFTFEIDDSTWQKLVNLEGVICYRFGQLKLEMICKSSDDQVEDNCKTNKVMAAANPQSSPHIEVPQRRLVRGDFPRSEEYANEKVLALIKAQNDLDISQWKPLPRKTNSSQHTFEVDDSSWHKLVDLEGVIFYRFGQLQLEMICKRSDDQIEENYKTNKVMAAANRQSSPHIEVPQRRLVRGDFPRSEEYANEKVLALIKAQNDLDISQWKPLPRKTKSSQLTFEVDDSSWHKLVNLEGEICYRLGKIKLELMETKSFAKPRITAASSNSKIIDANKTANSADMGSQEAAKERSRLEKLKSRIALRYEQMQLKPAGNDDPQLHLQSGRKVSPQKPYDRPQTSNRNVENSNSTARLAELKNRIAYRYDQMQVNQNENTSHSRLANFK